MKIKLLSVCLLLLAAVSLSACGAQTRRLRQNEVVDIAWEALSPSTSSQDRNNWVIVEANRLPGRQVVDRFTVLNINPCPGPMPPENLAIRASTEYWYIRAMPAPLLQPSPDPTQSANILPVNPEPLLREAAFLIDPFTGQVVARKFICLQYDSTP